jgi:uncharacterized membrane protein
MHGERVRLEALKKLNKSLKIGNNKGYTVAVALALILVSSLLIGYYLVSRLPPEGYSTIDLLDYQQKKAIDYPELLVINQNSTFNVWVEVENHMGKSQQFEVLLKVTNQTISTFPVGVDASNTYSKTLENGETWENLATVSINQPGNYSVVFELWIYDQNAGAFQFTYNYCILNVEAVDKV